MHTLTLLHLALWALVAVPSSARPTSVAPRTAAITVSSAAGQKEASRSPHGPLNIPCENCHTSSGWRPIRAVPEFDHNKTSYPLRGMHEKVQCTQCHVKPVFTNVGNNCADCHADIHRRQMGSNCAQCHTVQGWNIAVQQVRDHQNRFPLFGAHAAVQCDECHKQAATGVFLGLSTACDSCHLKDWQKTTNPPHQTAGSAFASSNCQSCHKFDSWLGASFSGDHAAPPINFPLTAGHLNVACSQCHVGNNYQLNIQANDCGHSGCHLTTYQQTNNPPHASSPTAFPIAQCSTCHTTAGWSPATGFDHSTTGFALTNAHAKVDCASCHKNNNYNLKISPTDCGNSGCHLTTWQQTNNPSHQSAGSAFAAANCSTCHDTIAWTDVTFNHGATGWPLTGSHQMPPAAQSKVKACTDCHVGNNYNLTSTDCYGCHQAAWNSTPTFGGNVPNHITSGFPTSQCASCHSTVDWTGATFDHNTTGFPLTNSHQIAPAGKVTGCVQCHINNNYTLKTQPNDCGNSGCHLTTWQQTNDPTHSTAGAPFAVGNCSTCHNTISWTAATFDHSTTGWPLTGSHQLAPAGKVVACTDCHVNNNYTFTAANTDCYGCHQTAWNSTQTLGGNVPNHVTAGFPTSQCSTCHSTTSWSGATFDHSTTGFPLTNSHQLAPAGKVTGCAQCHINNNYTLNIQPNDCGNSGCHLTTWQQTNNPTHSTAGAPFAVGNCSTCHNTITWTTAVFDHSTTGFPLTNSHQLAPAGKVTGCAQCHINNNYTLNIQPNDCGNSGCHLTTWQQTNNPTHSTAGAPFAVGNCSTCHNTITWTTAVFDHSTTGWALTGSHQLAPAGKVVACTDCHVNNNYTFTAANTDCYGCHQTAWNSTQTLGGNVPNHVSAGFPTAQCSTCHNTTTWATSTFDHNTTGFPLTNSHQLAPAGKVTGCAQCHINNNYALNIQPNDCGNSGCHLTTWQQTNNPTHSTAGAPFAVGNCSTCHNTITWTTAVFDHSTTGWALTGSHQLAPAGKVVACTDCHVNNNYTFTAANTDCYGCHQAAYNSTATLGGTVPNHVSAGFPTSQCINCHNTTSWKSTWSHASTGWALTGTHLTTACALCHVNNNYSLTTANTDCYGCHKTDWTKTVTMGGSVPNHVASGFSTSQCSTCHDTVNWADGKFDHSSTGWALTGAHALLPSTSATKVTGCADCHINNNYSLTTANTACYGCHQAAWLSTQTLGGAVPNHVSAGYPTTCDTCHTTTTWLGATFNHTYFKIPHHGSVCNDCHQVSTDYSSFTCISCHTTSAHSKSNTDNKHGGVGGYVYGPTTCYNCHKNGGG